MPIIRRSELSDKKDVTVNVEKARPHGVPSALMSLVSDASNHPKKGAATIVRRWPHSDEQHVSIEDGVVSLRTPKECTKWNQDFRLRIIRDYRAPTTLVDANFVERLYDPTVVYSVMQRKLMFRQKFAPLADTKTKVVVASNEVIDTVDGKYMVLKHPDPAMRVLMVYAFLRRMSFDGIASFTVYDWQDA